VKKGCGALASGKCVRFGAGRLLAGFYQDLNKLVLWPLCQAHGGQKSCREHIQNTKQIDSNETRHCTKLSHGATRSV